MPGIFSGRFANSSIIAMKTSKSIYLFDVLVMGRIEKAIKGILEANTPKKIIHDCSATADHLKHKHEIDLNGVFDTMVQIDRHAIKIWLLKNCFSIYSSFRLLIAISDSIKKGGASTSVYIITSIYQRNFWTKIPW